MFHVCPSPCLQVGMGAHITFLSRQIYREDAITSRTEPDLMVFGSGSVLLEIALTLLSLLNYYKYEEGNCTSWYPSSYL